jgi:hypothetical protein
MRNSPKTIAILLGSAALALLPSNAAGQFNNPPTAGTDSITIRACDSRTVNLTSNDTDPEGNYPLTVTSVEDTPVGNIFITSASSVGFIAYDAAYGDEADIVSYTVEDSLGASAIGHIYISVTTRTCP